MQTRLIRLMFVKGLFVAGRQSLTSILWKLHHKGSLAGFPGVREEGEDPLVWGHCVLFGDKSPLREY